MVALVAKVLRDREMRFVEEYCVDLHPKSAAERAGCPKSTCSLWGNEMLRRDDIKAQIDARLESLSKQSVVNAEWVRKRLMTVADRCMQAQPVMIPKRNEETGRNELVESGEYKFDSNGANKALELLGKHVGMFIEKAVITIDHELKQMTSEQLDARRVALMEEYRALELVQNPVTGVFEAPEPLLIENHDEGQENSHEEAVHQDS